MDLAIKNVPDEAVRRLRDRAVRNHRSLQGELLHIIEAAARETPDSDLAAVLAEVRDLWLTRVSESADMIRADRDRR